PRRSSDLPGTIGLHEHPGMTAVEGLSNALVPFLGQHRHTDGIHIQPCHYRFTVAVTPADLHIRSRDVRGEQLRDPHDVPKPDRELDGGTVTGTWADVTQIVPPSSHVLHTIA